MKDFTLHTYKKLLSTFMRSGYGFLTFAEHMQLPEKGVKIIILRHDVDSMPLRSLMTAEMENELGIKGTYYFRVAKKGFPKGVIERIANMGHEIGYHYDDLHAADGDEENALKLFQINLAKLRETAPVKTICMHGSPLSRHDNREIWRSRHYREFGIIGEPYFDIDFNEVMYLTDTGRRWDGRKVSIRDRASGYRREAMGDGEDKRGEGQGARGNGEDRGQKTEDRIDKKNRSRGAVCDPPALYIHATSDIINALKEDRLPDKIMLTIHPQRWTDNYFSWLKEFIWQNVKNLIKYLKIMKMRNSKRN